MTAPSTTDHPRFLRDLIDGSASRNQQRHAVRHLVAGCSTCAAQLKEHLFPARPSRRTLSTAIDRSVDHALGHAARWIVDVQREREEAEASVAALLELPAAHQALKVTNLRRAHRQGVCEALIDHARSERHESAAESLRFARLATVVAERLDPETCGETRARAWAEFGNALRLRGDHRESRRAFGQAERILREECADPLVEAEVASLKATLEGMDQRPDRAAALLERAARLQSRFSDLAGTAHTLLQLSQIYGNQLDDTDRGMRSAVAALELSEEAGDRGLKLIALQHLIHFLAAAGRPQEALRLLDRATPVFELGAPLRHRLRLRWLAGRLQAEVDDHRAAAETLLAVREIFLEQDLPFEVALVSLDLAVSWAHLGRRQRLRRLVRETAALLANLGLEPESLAAVQLLARTEAEEIYSAASQIAAAIEALRIQHSRT
ncbi:MAG: hypothetical protein AAF481_00240 [Acidobacteriota bacterium]